MIFRLLVCLLLCIAPCVAQAQTTASLPKPPAPTPVMFPFALPPFDSSNNALNVAWMSPAPAGARGFISTQGENFVDGQGRKIRFWGVNLNFAGVFPSKQEASGIAARLTKFGFNAVRLHHFEGYAAPNGIWKSAAIGSSKPRIPREFDAEQLDRFDFLVAELIKHGIYINLNLHVGRKTEQGEGVVYASNLPDKDKGVNYFDQRLIQLQKDFARQILTHVNPYTGRALKDEPGLCAVEVANENSLLGMWLDGSIRMPNEYSFRLRDKWIGWLKARYRDEATFRDAWTEINEALGADNVFALPYPEGIANPDAPDARSAVSTSSLQRLNLVTVSGGVGRGEVEGSSGPSVDGFVRPGYTASLDTQGNVDWSYQVMRDGLDLQEGQVYTLSFWARADNPRRISVNLWQDRDPKRFLGFTGYANLTVNWEKYTFVFRPLNPDPNHSRLSWNLGKYPGSVQLGEIDLRTGGNIAAPETWTLEHGVPIFEWKSTPIARARVDLAQFLSSIEASTVQEMRAYLKQLGVKVPIWHTQAQFGGWGGVLREADNSDVIDVHAYWKHPSFIGGGWSGTAWTVGNNSMVQSAATDPLSGFAHFRVQGKPFVMSEWNSGQPNDYGGESLLMAAAYAAWQDWAGVYLFDYHSSGAYNRDKFEGFFSIDSHPAKMGTATAAALLYRRPNTDDYLLGDVQTARDSVVLSLPRDMLWNEIATFTDGPTATPIIRTWREAGALRIAPLESKVYVRLADKGAVNTVTRTTARGLGKSPTLVSDTGEIQWDSRRGIFTVDGARSKVAIGFMGNKSLRWNNWQLSMPRSQSNWATFALSSLDGSETPASKRLLLTAVGKAENVGMGWNATRSSVGSQWGTGPTQVEGINASLRIVTEMKTARVWALDTSGERRAPVPARLRNGILTFDVSPMFKTIWYEIEGN